MVRLKSPSCFGLKILVILTLHIAKLCLWLHSDRDLYSIINVGALRHQHKSKYLPT